MAPHPRIRRRAAGREDAGDGRVRDGHAHPAAGQVPAHADHLPHRGRQEPDAGRARLRGRRRGLPGEAGRAGVRPVEGGRLRRARQEDRAAPAAGPAAAGERAGGARAGRDARRAGAATWSTRTGSSRASATPCPTTSARRSAGSRASAGRCRRARASGWTTTGRRYLDRVREASQQMSQLIDDVLYLARVTRAEMRGAGGGPERARGRSCSTGCRRPSPTASVEVKIRPGVVVARRTASCSGSRWRTCWRTPGSSPRGRRRRASSSASTQRGGRAGLLRARQRRRLRHGVRRPAVRPVPAAAPRRASSPAPASASPRCSASSTATAAGSGPRGWWGRAPPSTSPWAAFARDRTRRVKGSPGDVHPLVVRSLVVRREKEEERRSGHGNRITKRRAWCGTRRLAGRARAPCWRR